MYDRKIEGRELMFGVSGRLYQSNVLLYDKETESLWSQLREEAVAGKMTGTKLRPLPSVTTTWGRWKRQHPDTLVLSTDTGFSRPYDRDPYEGYDRSPDMMFPASRVDRRLAPKDKVVGIEVSGEEIAFPVARLAGAGRPVDVKLGGAKIEIRYDAASDTADALVDGKPVHVFTGYWFAWSAFHPGTKIWGEAAERRAAVPGTDSRVVIVEHEGEWADLAGVGPVGELDEGGSFYLIRGTVRNEAPSGVSYVKLSYELVNAAGEVVFREHGYNRRAEALRDQAFEAGKASPEDFRVEAIPPSGTDTFRMFFFRDELPPFESYRVRVEEAGAARSAVTARPD